MRAGNVQNRSDYDEAPALLDVLRRRRQGRVCGSGN